MERFLQRLGVDWIQFKALLITSIRMDFRGSRGSTGRRRRVSPIVWSLIIYGVMGGSLAGSVVDQTAPFLYSLLVLAYAMVMMIFAVVLELGNTILATDEAEVLAHRPMSYRTYFLAKLGNLVFYVLLMGTALCLIPSLVGMAVGGSRWYFPLVFLLVATVSNLATAGGVVLVYTGLLRAMGHDRFKDTLVYVQIVITFVVFFSYQIILRVSRESVGESADVAGRWLFAVPPAWFAGGIQYLLGLDRGMDGWLGLVGGGITVLLAVFACRRTAVEFGSLLTEPRSVWSVGESSPRRESRGVGGLSRWMGGILRFSETRAGFHFASIMLRKDRFVKMGIYPVFGIPLALVGLAILEKDLADPFDGGSLLGGSGTSAMIAFSVFFVLFFSLRGLTRSRDWEAAWIYRVVPMVSPGRFYQGVKMAVVLQLMLPFCVLLGIIYCTQIPLVHGMKHTVSLFLMGLVAFSVFSFSMRDYPFSKKWEKGEGIQRFGVLLWGVPFLGLFSLVQSVAYRSPIRWWLSQCGLFVLFIALESLAARRLDWRLRQDEFVF